MIEFFNKLISKELIFQFFDFRGYDLIDDAVNRWIKNHLLTASSIKS